MAAPATCTVSGVVYLGATGQPGQLVRWRVVSTAPTVAAGDGHVSGDPTIVYTAAESSWSTSLPQGLVVWIEIPAEGVDHLFTVPAISTATLSDVSLSRVMR